MRNKLFTTILMTAAIIGVLAAWEFQSGAAVRVQAAVESKVNPADSSTASQLPVIQDPIIREGWNILRSQNEQIRAANGVVVSGESLAQFLVESQIPVVWGSESICGGSSCSRMYCAPDGNCSYEDGQLGIDPIYLNPAIRTQNLDKFERLVGELAHEAYHRMRPFGEGTITQVEEYWAFYVDAELSQSGFPKFDGTDPQDQLQLERWFYTNGLHRYLKLAPYPGSAAPSFVQPPVFASEALE